MLGMAYLGRLLTDLAPQERSVPTACGSPRSLRSRRADLRAKVVAIDEVDGERRATLELVVTLPTEPRP